MTTYGFRKEQRLLTAHDYDQVFKQAQHRVNSREFLMLASDRDANVSRLGTVVSKKAAGNAVGRNRIRRLMKETFRIADVAPGVDVVIVARAAVQSKDNASLGKTLRNLWQDLERKRSA